MVTPVVYRRRMQVELQAMKRNPPSGIACYAKNDSLTELYASRCKITWFLHFKLLVSI